MANYKDIQGFHVQNLTSDPTPYAQALADNPYVGSWSSGGSLNQARSIISGAGIQTAALAFAGEPSPGYQLTEEFTASPTVAVTISSS